MRNHGQITLGYSPVIESDKMPFKAIPLDMVQQSDKTDEISRLNDRLKKMKIMMFRANNSRRNIHNEDFTQSTLQTSDQVHSLNEEDHNKTFDSNHSKAMNRTQKRWVSPQKMVDTAAVMHANRLKALKGRAVQLSQSKTSSKAISFEYAFRASNSKTPVPKVYPKNTRSCISSQTDFDQKKNNFMEFKTGV